MVEQELAEFAVIDPIPGLGGLMTDASDSGGKAAPEASPIRSTPKRPPWLPVRRASAEPKSRDGI